MGAHKKIVGVLLSAGSSQRFGSNKLKYPIVKDVPMAILSARNLKFAISDCLAVVPTDDDQLHRMYSQEGWPVVINPLAYTGVASSIVCAIKASSNADAWVIALADMPFIPRLDIQRVVTELQLGVAIVAPSYRFHNKLGNDIQRGHPVGFSRKFMRQLLSLKGDSGAASIIHQYSNQLLTFESEDDGVIRDIDSQIDLNLV